MFLLLVMAACDRGESFPRDPRTSYSAESLNGNPFPVFVGQDSVFANAQGIACNPDRAPNCIKRLARFYIDDATLAIGSPQYTYAETEFWIIPSLGDTVSLGAGIDAGTWQYDNDHGDFLFVTQNPGGVDLTEGEFHDRNLEVRGTARRFSDPSAGPVTVRLQPGQPLP